MISNSQLNSEWSHEISPTADITVNKFLKNCSKGKIGSVKKWIKSGKSLTIRDAQGKTPLMLAAASTSEKVFDLILGNTDDSIATEKDSTGRNALYYACVSNSVKRVRELQARGVTVIGCQYANMAVEYSSNPVIHELLGEETQRQLDIDGLVLQDCFDKYKDGSDNFESLAKEVYDKIGKKVTKSGLSDTNPIRVEKNFLRKKVLRSPETSNDIKDVIDSNYKKTSVEIAEIASNQFNFSVPTTKIESVRRAYLRDNEIRKKIAAHFKENPPANLLIASEYILETYGIGVSDDKLVSFLNYIGINFD